MATHAAAQPVFTGDPVDPGTAAAHVILPGLPLIHPGSDYRFNTGDEFIDTGLTGDVDIVVRTGGGYAGGPIPAPAASVAAAPTVIAGGLQAGAWTLVPVQVIVSDGVTPPVAGSPLLGPELDMRRTLIGAYPDLDGDGFIGPTATAGPLDLEVQRQEAFTLAGRILAVIDDGVATGAIGSRFGLPASAGGLGVLVGAGAVAGVTPHLYFDGPWIATRLPYLVPLDPDRVVGGENFDPGAPILRVDLEIEIGDLFFPAPNHPVLGTPFALPLDGSSLSNDLVRATSGAPVGAGFATPVDRTTFVATETTVLQPLIDGLGQRQVVHPAGVIALAADGAGNGKTVYVYPADLFANQTDPPVGGMSVTLEAGPNVRITAPDVDADPQRETIVFTSAAAATITLDDSGQPHGTAVQDAVVAVTNGVPTASLPVTVAAGPGGGVPGTVTNAKARVRFSPMPMKDSVTFTGTIATTGAAFADAFTLVLETPLGTLHSVALPAGSLVGTAGGKTYRFTDGVMRVGFKRGPSGTGTFNLKMRAARRDLPAIPATFSPLTGIVSLGASSWSGTVPCTANGAGTMTRCRVQP